MMNMAKNETVEQDIEEDVVDNDDVVDDVEQDDDVVDEQDKDDEPLGESGMRALEREREQRKALEKELREYKRQNESDQERALREAREEAANEASATWKTRFVKAEARSALTQAGVSSKSEKLLNLIDLDAVEIDDDGEVSGLNDQIDGLKEDFPQLFAAETRRKTRGDVGPKETAKPNKSIGEQLEAQLRGR